MIERLLKPKIDKSIRVCEDHLNEIKSQFCLARRLKGGLYMIEMTKILLNFIADVTEIVKDNSIGIVRSKSIFYRKKCIAEIKEYYKNIAENFVFNAHAVSAQAGENDVNSFRTACEEQKKELTKAINDGIKSIECKLNICIPSQLPKTFFNLIGETLSKLYEEKLIAFFSSVMVYYVGKFLKNIL